MTGLVRALYWAGWGLAQVAQAGLIAAFLAAVVIGAALLVGAL